MSNVSSVNSNDHFREEIEMLRRSNKINGIMKHRGFIFHKEKFDDGTYVYESHKSYAQSGRTSETLEAYLKRINYSYFDIDPSREVYDTVIQILKELGLEADMASVDYVSKVVVSINVYFINSLCAFGEGKYHEEAMINASAHLLTMLCSFWNTQLTDRLKNITFFHK